jgi:hypothetical protein
MPRALTETELRHIDQAAELAFMSAAAVGIALGSDADFAALNIPGWSFKGSPHVMVDERGRGCIQRADGVHGLGFRPLLVILLPSAKDQPQAWWKARVVDLRQPPAK